MAIPDANISNIGANMSNIGVKN